MDSFGAGPDSNASDTTPLPQTPDGAPPMPPYPSPAQQPADVPAPQHLTPAAVRKLITDAGVTQLYDIQLIQRLVAKGKLNAHHIGDFVSQARAHGQNVQTFALTSKLAGEADLVAVTAELYGMQPVVLSQTAIEEDIALLITAEQANMWRVLPYSRDELGQLLVAISDPQDVSARENLQRALPRETIQWRFALDAELTMALDRVYQDAASAAAVNQQLQRIAAETVREERITVRGSGLDGGIIGLVNSIIHRAEKEGASDIHIEPRERDTMVRFRVDGMLREAMRPLPQGETTKQVIARIKTLANMKTDERRRPQDGRVTIAVGAKPLDLRVVTVPTIYGEQVTIRLLDQTRAMLSLEDLGMTQDNLHRYEQAIRLPHGCAIITGPTGSGKSTTLYSSAVRVVSPERKFISIEDPVEYRIPGITQIDVSGHGESKMDFAEALRAILRSDPDIVMVGEIRDRETAMTAVEAALTGHFLYSTLHTNDALGSVSRLQRLKVEPLLIAEAVAVFVAQRLVRRLCTECKLAYRAETGYLHGMRAPAWALKQAEEQGGLQVFRAREGGCTACRGTGYRGRTGVHEVITMTEELKNAIVANAAHEQLERLVRSQGMHSLRDDAFIKVAAGVTSMEELARVMV